MQPLLEVNDLQMEFGSGESRIQALDRVSFHADPGKVLCIVGESGCGKSVTALSIMGLLPKNARVTGGSIRFDGQDLLHMDEAQLNKIRGNTLAMIFQDAMTSLNPVFTVGNQLTEAIRLHSGLSKKDARERAAHKMEQVGLSAGLMKKYPHTLSGGMRQRVMIAMALSGDPKLLIADEPTTALDVTIQAQIVRLLKGLRRKLGLSVILITHDIGLVAETADSVLVMYAGQVVEEADVFSLFHRPAHPYTYALLRSVPGIHKGKHSRLISIGGVVPEHYQQISGCRFFGRCPFAQPECREPQELKNLKDGRAARCRRAGKDWENLSAETAAALGEEKQRAFG